VAELSSTTIIVDCGETCEAKETDIAAKINERPSRIVKEELDEEMVGPGKSSASDIWLDHWDPNLWLKLQMALGSRLKRSDLEVCQPAYEKQGFAGD
jgi:hypothetical protein